MVNILNYIGPFLRSNSSKPENIGNQLFYLSKEAVTHLALHSKCGISISPSELKIKNLPNVNSNTINNFSPLLCVYKKGSPKLIEIDDGLCWNEDKFKKEINISSNAYMTLCLLELCDYYDSLKTPLPSKYSYKELYGMISRKQLEFYATFLRNDDGVFVDKKQIEDNLSKDLTFENKEKKFKFSNQGLLMAAFYKYSCLFDDKVSTEYRNFSMDIFKMFLDYREELYNLSYEELAKLSLGLNLFYEYSKNSNCLSLLLDLYDIMEENYMSSDKLENISLFLMDCAILYKNTGYSKFEKKCDELKEMLIKNYSEDKGLLIKDNLQKEINFTSTELFYNFISLFMYHDINNEESLERIIQNLYKESIINSGIILSWPDAPNVDNPERYRNYSLKSEDIIEESFFRNPAIPSATSIEIAPVIIKNVTYNTKKDEFKTSKQTFDSSYNFPIYYMCLYTFKPKKS